MFRRKARRKDKEVNEIAAAHRLRSIGETYKVEEADPDEITKRIRNMTFGSTASRVAATRNAGETSLISAV